mmetsp:Transcript_97309/g.270716  ORF Transcript_97309/g.270716 Transcript_97309/m.270716 type:complete len:86 (-) Transcript_97309:170-427(-)
MRAWWKPLVCRETKLRGPRWVPRREIPVWNRPFGWRGHSAVSGQPAGSLWKQVMKAQIHLGQRQLLRRCVCQPPVDDALPCIQPG